MEVDNFTLDAENATLVKNDVRLDDQGNKVIRQKFDNGFVLVYTKTKTGFKRLDFSHELLKTPLGTYKADLNSSKKDFYDYY